MITKIKRLLKKVEATGSIDFKYHYTLDVLARDLEKLFIKEQSKTLKELGKRLFPVRKHLKSKKKGGDKNGKR